MTRKVALIVISFFLFGASFASAAPKSLIRIDGLTLEQVRDIGMRGFDVAKAGPTFVEVVVNGTERKKLAPVSTQVKVLIPDLDAYITAILSKQTREAKYYTYETMTATLQGWAEKYSSIARLESIGKTWEGREIWAMKVSDNPQTDEPEPAVLIMGANHAREWISVEVPMETLKQYLEGYGTDPRLTELVNGREVWFVPMANPDGITYSMNKSRYWRKNRRNNNNRDYGVDMNRNYGYKWGNVGASNSFSSDTYHGPNAWSEPETQAIKMLAEREHFQGSASFHSYSELILYPFGYGYNIPCEDTPTLAKLAGEMAKFNQYTPQNSADLYPAMGDSDDWLYGDHKTLAFTFELAQTFIPAPAEIAGINQLNVPAMFHLIDKAAAYGLTKPTGADPALHAGLSLSEAIRSLSAAQAVAGLYQGESRARVQEQLNRISNRLAELVLVDLEKGSLDSFRRLKNLPEAAAAVKIAQEKANFKSLHGESFNHEVSSEMSLQR